MQIYKCDNEKCKNSEDTAEFWLTIGSSNGGDLFVYNNLPDKKMYEMNNHKDIHFCSKECLIKFFFQ